ncbi:metalloregulator ArsR/SmtB family transcription factor [Pseudarthrobacter sp902506025]|jgi:DNA-binding transcriptional ArsR family regulator|uniref:DNA-binding transcriptional ArsR family regulator n=1 Tax=Pseudarthrobacter defluvii TaxID=410837 RepID=A0ABT9UF72_9MICC|nr:MULTISPECIES: metalloregulator ArsR/SmtB family transcription factor [Micrococcaceae]MDQ0118290.1 DNA-binding transcriptional ArsR family regulator [Pseudarthrobacter defluvii]
MVTDDVFAVIAESTRRDILVALRAGDKAVGELVEELAASQPTISKHLKVLREAQLVSMRAQGQKRYYALNRGPLEGIASWLETFDVGTAGSAAAAPSGADQSAAVPSPAAQAEAAPEVPAHLQEGVAAAAASLPPAPRAAQPAVTQKPREEVPAPLLVREGAELSPAVVIPGGTAAPLSDDTVPQQIGRTVGRAATKAADLLASLPNLPKFGRKK